MATKTPESSPWTDVGGEVEIEQDAGQDREIARQVKEWRMKRGMSQSRLAFLIGTKPPGMSRMEKSRDGSWRVGTLRKIALALDLKLDVAFLGTGSVSNREPGRRQAFRQPDNERVYEPIDNA